MNSRRSLQDERNSAATAALNPSQLISSFFSVSPSIEFHNHAPPSDLGTSSVGDHEEHRNHPHQQPRSHSHNLYNSNNNVRLSTASQRFSQRRASNGSHHRFSQRRASNGSYRFNQNRMSSSASQIDQDFQDNVSYGYNSTNNDHPAGSSVSSYANKLPFRERFIREIQDIGSGIRMTPGDMGSLCQLFFDNLSTILGVLFATQDLTVIGKVSSSTMNRVLFQQVVPGLGLTLAIGNLYYAWMAIRLTNMWGRQYTAQPYGINTYSAFAFVYNIIYPVFFALKGREKPDGDGSTYTADEAFLVAYRVALASNFIQGIISIVVGIVGPVLLRYIQPVALLVPVAGIGLAFLGLEQLTNCLAAPIVGYNTILWVFLGWYAGVKVGFNKRRIPEALMVILVGVALGWSTGLNKASDVREASKLVTAVWPSFTGAEIFENFDMTREYLGIIIPLGISGPINSLMCLVCAKEAGDPFPVRETLIMDGIGTMIASFFGSPFGTVVYIGHPAHKRSGATVGYSVANGFIYLVLSLFGFLAVFQAAVNQATTGPIVFTIGLLVNEEILNFMSPRHFPAYLLGIFPAIYDWAVNVAARTPVQDMDTSYNSNLPGASGWYGVLAWKRGSLLVSMIWTSLIVSVIDRKWRHVSAWAMIGALLSLTGLIHIPIAGFENLTTPVWEQCSSESTTCWEYGQQWMFVTAYAMIAATAMLVNFAKGWDITIQDEIHDSYSYESNDWFAAAAVDSHPHGETAGNPQSQMTHTFGDVTVMISDNVGYSDGRFRFAIASEDRRVVIDAKTREAGQRWLQSLEISDTTGLRIELEQAHTEIIDYERRIEELEDLVAMMSAGQKPAGDQLAYMVPGQDKEGELGDGLEPMQSQQQQPMAYLHPHDQVEEQYVSEDVFQQHQEQGQQQQLLPSEMEYLLMQQQQQQQQEQQQNEQQDHYRQNMTMHDDATHLQNHEQHTEMYAQHLEEIPHLTQQQMAVDEDGQVQYVDAQVYDDEMAHHEHYQQQQQVPQQQMHGEVPVGDAEYQFEEPRWEDAASLLAHTQQQQHQQHEEVMHDDGVPTTTNGDTDGEQPAQNNIQSQRNNAELPPSADHEEAASVEEREQQENVDMTSATEEIESISSDRTADTSADSSDQQQRLDEDDEAAPHSERTQFA